MISSRAFRAFSVKGLTRSASSLDGKKKFYKTEGELNPNSIEIGSLVSNKVLPQMNYSKELYNWAIEKGIAKEQARAVLPEGNTISRVYVNGTLRSWIHYIELRSGNGTQLEHMEVARACAEVITNIFPLTKEYVQE